MDEARNIYVKNAWNTYVNMSKTERQKGLNLQVGLALDIHIKRSDTIKEMQKHTWLSIAFLRYKLSVCAISSILSIFLYTLVIAL